MQNEGKSLAYMLYELLVLTTVTFFHENNNMTIYVCIWVYVYIYIYIYKLQGNLVLITISGVILKSKRTKILPFME